MAIPKQKISRANTHTRRSTWKANLTRLSTVRVASREVRVPRRLVKVYRSGLLGIEA